mmetsp:Transcript_27096/g.65884  ORF Transcript_27096/g.65884 Transcript_27096/m.65884 type:complete len:107 (+) Transcript_27096:2483-2803(+)
MMVMIAGIMMVIFVTMVMIIMFMTMVMMMTMPNILVILMSIVVFIGVVAIEAIFVFPDWTMERFLRPIVFVVEEDVSFIMFRLDQLEGLAICMYYCVHCLAIVTDT